MLNNKFHMIVISIDWSFIWYNTSAYLCNILTMVEHFLNIPIFQWRRVTSQFKKMLKITVYPCQHQMHSMETVLNNSLESIKIYLSLISDNCPL